MSISSLGDDMVPPTTVTTSNTSEAAPLVENAEAQEPASTPNSEKVSAEPAPPTPPTVTSETSMDGTNTSTVATADASTPDPVIKADASPSPASSTVATTEVSPTPVNTSNTESVTVSAPTDSTPGQTVTPPSPNQTNTIKSEYDQITDMLLSTIGDPGMNQHMKIMIYGDPGSRKTSWLGQVPNNLIWDMEDGVVAIKSAAITTGIPTAPGVQVIPFKSMYQGKMIIERIAARTPGFDKFGCFSVDTVSDISKRELMRLSKEAFAMQPLSRREFTPDTPEYVEVNNMLAEFVRDLRDLPCDIVVTAHAKTVEPKNKPAKTYPDFSESLANKLEAMMDIVAYAEKRIIDGQEQIVWRVSAGDGIHAKTRIPLPTEILNPSYADLRAVWENVLNS